MYNFTRGGGGGGGEGAKKAAATMARMSNQFERTDMSNVCCTCNSEELPLAEDANDEDDE